MASPVPTFSQAQSSYPPGTTFTGVVQSVRPEIGRAWVQLADGLQATLTAADVGPGEVLSLESFLARGQNVARTSKGVVDRNGRPQIQAEIRTMAVPTIVEQLNQIGIRPGVVLTGQVRRTVDNLGVFVDLSSGVHGLVHVRALEGRAISSFARGAKITVRVVNVAEDRKHPGKPAISLALL